MKPSSGIPVRIQKVGDAARPCTHLSQQASQVQTKPGALAKPAASQESPPIEPKVEIREVEPAIFEITVTCRCGQRSVVRCESLQSDPDKKS